LTLRHLGTAHLSRDQTVQSLKKKQKSLHAGSNPSTGTCRDLAGKSKRERHRETGLDRGTIRRILSQSEVQALMASCRDQALELVPKALEFCAKRFMERWPKASEGLAVEIMQGTCVTPDDSIRQAYLALDNARRGAIDGLPCRRSHQLSKALRPKRISAGIVAFDLHCFGHKTRPILSLARCTTVWMFDAIPCRSARHGRSSTAKSTHVVNRCRAPAAQRTIETQPPRLAAVGDCPLPAGT
jgi:hypothetical protein